MKQKITVAVIAMIISLSGIIILQLYWINGAIKVRSNQFDGQVLDAVNDVTGKIQLREVMTIMPKIFPDFDSAQRQHVDSVFNRRLARRHLRHPYSIHIAKRYQHIEENPFVSDQNDQNFPKPRNYSKHVIPPFELPERMSSNSYQTDSDMADSAHRLIAKANAYGRAMHKMIANYVSANRDIHKRLDERVIDSLLHIELHHRGIDIPYQSAVMNMQTRKLDFMKPGSDTANLSRSIYKSELFPEDYQPQPYYLTVFFPGKQIFVLRSIGMILPGSFLFMLIIIISCGFTVFMLLKQKKLSEMKNDFINNMTHEFKTPIATISLATDAIIDPRIMDDKEKLRRYVLMIKEENTRMNLQVQNVLNAATMDKGDFKLQMAPFNAVKAIEKLIERFRLQIADRNGRLNLVADAENFTIHGDEIHFENLMNNLLDNACKYSLDAPEINVKAYNQNNSMVIEVEDHGPGMSRETQKKVFDKFYRVSTGNLHDIKGFGLGLSYAKAVVTAFHGSIEVKSELRKGSIFTITIPLYNDFEPKQ